ncbi:MAG: glycoside hydrolase family 65 protein, partial [Fulvivirga sp.]
MKNYIKHDPWSIIEEGFDPKLNQISESIFSIGNGMFGQRANFEEKYSGETLQGNYVAGVYYPDKTRVGWWKNGYPEYFAKVLNAANWIGINIEFDGEVLDLHDCKVSDFRRELNMNEGWLKRSFKATLPSGKSVKVSSTRITSMVRTKIGAIAYTVTPLNFSGKTKVTPYVDFDVINADSNYDEKFWVEQEKKASDTFSYVMSSTKKTDFWVATGMQFNIDGGWVSSGRTTADREKYVEVTETGDVKEGESFTIYKYAANISSMYHEKKELSKVCAEAVADAAKAGFDQLLAEHVAAW